MYTHILVGTDGSKTATKAVERAVQVAKSTGATLTIMTAASEKKGRPIVESAAAALAGSGVSIDTLVSDADPATALAEAAERGGYDLIVVGNKGMTGLTRFLQIGAVPNKLSHVMPTSMLVVRTT